MSELPEQHYIQSPDHIRLSDIIVDYPLRTYEYAVTVVGEKELKMQVSLKGDPNVLIAEIFECYSFGIDDSMLTDTTKMYITVQEIQFKYTDTAFKKYIMRKRKNKMVEKSDLSASSQSWRRI